MRKHYDSTDEYYIFMCDRILRLAPVIGLCAALTFTFTRLMGYFSGVNLTGLVLFDAVCLSYFAVAHILRRRGIVRKGEVDQNAMFQVEIVLDALVLLQWNLITYIFPTRTLWGYAPMFVLLTAFMFQKRAVLLEIIGLSVSIAISWLIIGDKLLPYLDDMYMVNLSMRIVALVISFSVIYILTHYAEKFTLIVKKNFKDLEKQNDSLETMGRDVIDFTAEIIEERDSTSGTHVKRLKKYTKILAEQVAKDCPEYGLTEDIIEQISLACVLHDVGKIGIPDNILLKPGKLTPEEFEIIKKHTVIGAQVIDKLPDSVGEDYKRYCRDICLFHHEKYDGKGYPTGIKGDDIPISAQIVSVVDCYDALSNARSYKPALPGDVAINMILNGECGAFSDKMKACIIACRDQILHS